MATNPKQTVALIDLAVTNAKEQRTARVESALRRLDGLTLLEWCIRRLSESTLIDTIVVTGPPHYRELISQTGLCNARWMPSALARPHNAQKNWQIDWEQIGSFSQVHSVRLWTLCY